MSRLESVCVVHAVHPDPSNPPQDTAIDKRPVAGRVHVGELGLAGDRQCDREHHGGPEQAVYAYAAEDVEHWARELGRTIEPGAFGENLRTRSLEVTGALIGETWRIGGTDGVVLEVTSPRVPCFTFAAWMDEPGWIKRFTQHGALGAYLRVLREGQIGAGDEIEVLARPGHGVTVGDTFPHLSPAHGRLLLDSERADELRLCVDLRESAERAAARAQA